MGEPDQDLPRPRRIAPSTWRRAYRRFHGSWTSISWGLIAAGVCLVLVLGVVGFRKNAEELKRAARAGRQPADEAAVHARAAAQYAREAVRLAQGPGGQTATSRPNDVVPAPSTAPATQAAEPIAPLARAVGELAEATDRMAVSSARSDEPEYDFSTLVFLAAQLFVLNSGSVEGPVSWELNLARFAAAAVSAGFLAKAAALLFRRQLQTLTLRRLREHVIVCGAGRKGHQLVKEFLDRGHDVVAIELGERQDHTEIGHELGSRLLFGNATDPAVLHRAGVHHARYLLAACGDDGTNVQIAVAAYDLAKAHRSPSLGPLLTFVHVLDLKLFELFKRTETITDRYDVIDVRVFDSFVNSARLLLSRYPLDWQVIRRGDSHTVHLVILGFRRMGQSLVLQAAKVGHFANGRKLRITVVDREADARRRSFLARHPQIATVCDLEFRECYVDDPEFHNDLREWAADEDQVLTIAVCLHNDHQAVSSALGLPEEIRRERIPVLVRLSERRGIASLLSAEGLGPASRVRPFGALDEACSVELVLRERLDTVAREIHHDYTRRRTAEGKSPGELPTMLAWEALDEEFKDSCRQQADHIDVKLRAIGCRRVPQGEATGPVVAEFTAEEVELMAGMEHQRWCADRRLNGWQYGPTRSNTARLHPNLLPWDQLPVSERQYDREFVVEIPHYLECTGEVVCREVPAIASPEAQG